MDDWPGVIKWEEPELFNMELSVITHPGFGAVMDPIINVNKPKQPESPDDGIYPNPNEPVEFPVIVGELPPVPEPSMGAIRIRMPGGPEVLEFRTVTIPTLKRGEVLIRVTAASVNNYDILLRKGWCLPAPGDIIYPGIDCSGVIEKLGPKRWLMKIIACQYREITGGGTGIGTFAIQFAKAKGCKVYCTTSTDEKRIKCEGLGADIAINHNDHDFVDRIYKDTVDSNEPGVDMVLDVVGAAWTSQNLRVLKRDGIIFIVGMRGGKAADILLGPAHGIPAPLRQNPPHR